MNNIIYFFDHHQGFVAIIAAAICSIPSLLVVIFALYFNSSVFEHRKQNKIKLLNYKIRLYGNTYEQIMKVYIDYTENRSDSIPIQQYTKWNKYTPTVCKIKYNQFDLTKHEQEIEYLNYLVKNNVIYFYNSPIIVVDNKPLYSEYILTPSENSWNKVEKEYRKSKRYKTREKLKTKIYDYFLDRVKDKSKRSFIRNILNIFNIKIQD